MRFALMLNNKVHQIIESETKPIYPPDPDGNEIEFIDISKKPKIMENWEYNNITGEFEEPKEIFETPIIDFEPSEQDIINAQLLMNQAEILITLNELRG